jgi:hypothetical protein
MHVFFIPYICIHDWKYYCNAFAMNKPRSSTMKGSLFYRICLDVNADAYESAIPALRHPGTYAAQLWPRKASHPVMTDQTAWAQRVVNSIQKMLRSWYGNYKAHHTSMRLQGTGQSRVYQEGFRYSTATICLSFSELLLFPWELSGRPQV